MTDCNEKDLRAMLEGTVSNHTFNTNYLVEAGAGAGKTHTMIQRIVNQLMADVCKPDQMVIITFTVKATNNLRKELDRTLRLRLQQESHSEQAEKIKKIRNSIGQMQISTIHSFCQTLLQSMPFDSGLGLGFHLLDAQQEDLQQTSFFNEICQQDTKRFAQIKRLGINPYSLLQCFHDFANTEAEIQYVPTSDTSVSQAEQLLRKNAKIIWKSMYPSLNQIGSDFNLLVPELQKLVRNNTLLNNDCDDCFILANLLLRQPDKSLHKAVINSNTPEGKTFCQKCNLEGKRKTGADQNYIKSHPLADKMSLFHQIWESKEYTCIKKMRNIIVYSTASELLSQLVTEYRKMKDANQQAGYLDLMIKTRDMLQNSVAARDYFRSRYHVFYVDEFQDTSPIQAEILFYLSSIDENHCDSRNWKNCIPRTGSLFLVGDPKQGIYRFRGADINIYNTVKELLQNKQCNGSVVSLSWNFRSSNQICAFSDEVFAPKSTAFPLVNGLDEPTLCGGPYQASFSSMEAQKEGFPSSYTLSYPSGEERSKPKNLSSDASRVAGFIQSMVENKVRLGEDKHEAQYSDFLILTVNKSDTTPYAATMKKRGIPVTISGKQEFSSVEPIRRAIYHLNSLQAPDNEIMIASVLQNCYGISLPAIRQIKQQTNQSLLALLYAGKAETIRTAISDEAKDSGLLSLCDALIEMRKLRQMATQMPALSFFEYLFSGGFGLWPKAQSLEQCREDYANVQQFLTLIGTITDRSFASLCQFALDCAKTSFEHELPLVKADNCVRVMNLHKAKGLEAEIVILAYGKAQGYSPNRYIWRDDTGSHCISTIYSKSGYYSHILATPENWDENQNNCSIPYEEQEIKFLKAERIRLLYVAATRAKSWLLISDAGNDHYWTPLVKKATAVTDFLKSNKDTSELNEICSALRVLAGQSNAAGLPEEKRPAAYNIDACCIESTLVEMAKQCCVNHLSMITPSTLDDAAKSTTGKKGKDDLDSPIIIRPDKTDATPYGPDWGTIIHRTMELCVRKQTYNAKAILAAARQAVTEVFPTFFLTKAQTKMLRIPNNITTYSDFCAELASAASQAISFLSDPSCDLRKAIDHAQQTAPEMPFFLHVSCKDEELYQHLQNHLQQEETTGKTFSVHGIIDLALKNSNSWTVIDYKTDRIKSQEKWEDYALRLKQQYTPQISTYSKVLTQAGQSVNGAFLCSIPYSGKLIPLNFD